MTERRHSGTMRVSPMLRALLCGLLLVALPTPLATAENSSFELELRLSSGIEKMLDDILARLQRTHAIELATVPAEKSARAYATDLDSLPLARHPDFAPSFARYRVHNNRLGKGIARFMLYQSEVSARFREAGLPQELALLGLVESGFDPLALSPKQARGIWQFIPETARRYGLRIGWGIDERTDPEKSTRAVARYLADLYAMFGDWPLALAAYNAGEKRVLEAMARSPGEGRKDFWSLSRLRLLPAETRNYVPAVLATIVTLRGQLPALEADPQDENWRQFPQANLSNRYSGNSLSPNRFWNSRRQPGASAASRRAFLAPSRLSSSK